MPLRQLWQSVTIRNGAVFTRRWDSKKNIFINMLSVTLKDFKEHLEIGLAFLVQ